MSENRDPFPKGHPYHGLKCEKCSRLAIYATLDTKIEMAPIKESENGVTARWVRVWKPMDPLVVRIRCEEHKHEMTIIASEEFKQWLKENPTARPEEQFPGVLI